MKKIMICAAALAMLGLSACSNKEAKEAADSVNVEIQEVTEVTVDSINPDSAAVNVAQQTVETVTPATEAQK